ncbi:MAG: type I DNA topoisomerase [Brevinematales bacterium]
MAIKSGGKKKATVKKAAGKKGKSSVKKEKLKKLVIVESPSKASTIKKYLGKDYEVKASVGHVIDLPRSRMGVNLETFDPDYIIMRDKYKVIKELRESARTASEVILASDPDREGEAIAWHIKNDFEKNVFPKIKDRQIPIKRVKFNEITLEEIEERIKHPENIDLKLVDSQQGRRVIDRIFGYELSPLLWKKVKSKLSAGRVQSVALRLICEREIEIEKFIPCEYWEIEADLKKRGGNIFSASLVRIDGKKAEINDEVSALRIEKELLENSSIIKDIKKKIVTRSPYPPFITSTLQQAANNLFGFTSMKTMMLAQQLYEGIDIGNTRTGLITYMRTDSTRISPVAIAEVRKYIKEQFGESYIPENPNYFSNKKTSQDAHEAIRPTHVFNNPDLIKENLTGDQYKLYSLIWKRFTSSQMSSSRSEQITVEIANGNKILTAGATKIIFEGFLKVTERVQKEKELPPNLAVNDSLETVEIKKEQKFTEPPPRYSEASIVKAMEELGIGRPSTYAPTIFTLTKRFYVKKEGRTLVPTFLGSSVNKLLVENFPELINTNFTAEMEEELDDVEDGKKKWKSVVGDFYSTFRPVLAKAYENIDSIKGSFDEETDFVCEKCGRKMVKKLGKFGLFLACSGWPECKNAKPLPLGKCPKCGTGYVVAKKGRSKRAFYGCTNYPDCDFTSFLKPVEIDGKNLSCPVCTGALFGQKEKGRLKTICLKEGCTYESKFI